jgi:hypothetical protein
MKNSWKRDFYFPNREYILTTNIKRDENNLNTNYTKLAERYYRTSVHRK